MVPVVLFDLDGTLVDSSRGIVHCAHAALRAHGLDPRGRDIVGRFIGPPLAEGFAAIGAPEALIDDLVVTYREHYAAGAMYDVTVYDGIPELLETLRAWGATLAVATSKLTEFARAVVGHTGLDRHLPLVLGSERDGRRASKAEVIGDVLAALGRAGDAVMVGDREHDAWGAATAGVRFVGATWGFGSAEELRRAGAQGLAGHPSEVPALLRGVPPGPGGQAG